jgi:aconitate hydratase
MFKGALNAVSEETGTGLDQISGVRGVEFSAIAPLTFADPADYKRVEEGDRVSVIGLAALAPGRPLRVVLHHPDGGEDAVEVRHTLNQDQIAWFRAGSALNLLRAAG